MLSVAGGDPQPRRRSMDQPAVASDRHAQECALEDYNRLSASGYHALVPIHRRLGSGSIRSWCRTPPPTAVY